MIVELSDSVLNPTEEWGLFPWSALFFYTQYELRADFQNAIQFLLLKITLQSLEFEKI